MCALCSIAIVGNKRREMYTHALSDGKSLEFLIANNCLRIKFILMFATLPAYTHQNTTTMWTNKRPALVMNERNKN